jgi:F-type H+-transporting ATPase subunit b
MEPLIATFHIDWKIIIAQAVNFAVVFAVLYIYALKPLSKLMAERSEKIAKGITDAKQNAETLEKSRKEYEDTLAKARKEAQKLFEEGKKEAQAKKEAMLLEAKAEVAGMIESGKKTLEAEKTKMVNDAKKEIVNLVVLATEKLTDSKDPKFQERAQKELASM